MTHHSQEGEGVGATSATGTAACVWCGQYICAGCSAGFDPSRIAALEQRMADLEEWASGCFFHAENEPFQSRAYREQVAKRMAYLRERALSKSPKADLSSAMGDAL